MHTLHRKRIPRETNLNVNIEFITSSPPNFETGTLKCPRADSACVRLSLRKWCARLGESVVLWARAEWAKGGSVGVDPLNSTKRVLLTARQLGTLGDQRHPPPA
jgi:hypothetical protein